MTHRRRREGQLFPWYGRAVLRMMTPVILVGSLLHLDPVGWGIGTALAIGLVIDSSGTG